MTTTNYEQVSKDVMLLATFWWGAAPSFTFKRVTNWSHDVTDATLGVKWDSVPTMEVEKIKITIGMDEKPPYIWLPSSLDWVARLSNGEPHARINVTIQEQTVADDGTTERIYLFRGRVSRSELHAEDKVGMCRLELITPKQIMKGIPLGQPLEDFCIRSFGGPGCWFPVDQFKETKVMGYILGKRVGLSGLPYPGSGTGATTPTIQYWRNGYVERDGLRIKIRDVQQVLFGDEQPYLPVGIYLVLAEEPPADWEDQLVIATPGCTKSPTRCTEWFGHTEQFAGFGIGIPAHDPTLEEP